MVKSLDALIEDLESVSRAVCQMRNLPASEVRGTALDLGEKIEVIAGELRAVTAKMDVLLDEIEKGIIPVPGGKQQ